MAVIDLWDLMCNGYARAKACKTGLNEHSTGRLEDSTRLGCAFAEVAQNTWRRGPDLDVSRPSAPRARDRSLASGFDDTRE